MGGGPCLLLQTRDTCKNCACLLKRYGSMCAQHADSGGAESVQGIDERVLVKDPTTYPYNSIGFLEVRSNKAMHASIIVYRSAIVQL